MPTSAPRKMRIPIFMPDAAEAQQRRALLAQIISLQTFLAVPTLRSTS
jgi:hypothetical protein